MNSPAGRLSTCAYRTGSTRWTAPWWDPPHPWNVLPTASSPANKDHNEITHVQLVPSDKNFRIKSWCALCGESFAASQCKVSFCSKVEVSVSACLSLHFFICEITIFVNFSNCSNFVPLKFVVFRQTKKSIFLRIPEFFAPFLWSKPNGTTKVSYCTFH